MKIKIKNFTTTLSALLLLLSNIGCNKTVDVPEPTNTVTSAETFAQDGTANSAVAAIYSNMMSSGGSPQLSNSLATFYGGISADELLSFNQSDANLNAFQTNSLNSYNQYVSGYWPEPYKNIYMANGVIEGLNASKTVSAAIKTQLLGEAKFLRAFWYFYLVNWFGGVPLVTSTNYAANAILPNSTPSVIYEQMISDLLDAQNTLTSDYSYSKNERTRANKWAATALLARVYLYYAAVSGDNSYYAKAITQASAVITNSGTYSLVNNLNKIFLANSSEAIWQLQPNANSAFVTTEGNYLIPYNNTSNPSYYLTTQLLNSFEPNDQRKAAWINSTTYLGTTYYYPFKYKMQTAGSLSATSEYYMVLRLAEQYLIRAEAEAQTNDLSYAINDLNTIRARAGLPNLSATLDQSHVLAAVAQERKIELFAEWGHRWFDLKRTGQATTVLSSDKALPVTNNALLWPIPISEVQEDPFLKQNPGY